MVNELIYGKKSTWENVGTTDIKVSNFGTAETGYYTSDLATGYANGNIPTNTELDNSVCHSALGNTSALSTINWVANEGIFASDELPCHKFAFCFGKSNIGTNHYSYEFGKVKNPIILVPEITNSSLAASTTVFNDFDYKKMRALIRVRAQQTKTKDPNENAIDKTLEDYVNNFASEYPYIKRVYFVLHYKVNDMYVTFNQRNLGFLSFEKFSYTLGLKENSSKFYTEKYTTLNQFASYIDTLNSNNYTITLLGHLHDYGYYTDTALKSNKYYISAYTGGGNIEQSGSYFYFNRDYDNTFNEYMLTQMSHFGIQFVTDSQYLQDDISSNNVYMGLLDNNFIGTGQYTHGKDNLQNQQYLLNSANDSTFDPSKEIDTNTYYNESTKPHDVLSSTAFTTKYVLTFSNLQSLANKFYNVMDFKPENLDFNNYNTSLFLTNNALDTIVSCKKFPFQVASTGAENVQFGRYTTDIQAPTTAKKVQVFEFSGFSCYREFGDFRDYEPFTNYELKIPFCGSVKLSTAECVGLPITVTLSVDIETGNCTAFIYADNKLIDSVSGNCSVDVAISGIQQATLDSQIFNAAINQRQAKINSQFVTAKGVISMAGAVTGILKSKKSPMALTQSIGQLTNSITNQLQSESDAAFTEKRTDYELSHVQTPYKCVGGVSSAVCESESMQCVLIKSTPKMLDEYNKNIYAATVGFACCINTKLGNMRGLTVCSDIDTTGIQATETEKSIIKQLCCSGVRV